MALSANACLPGADNVGIGVACHAEPNEADFSALPVARVLPLVDVPHLDRGFDYNVPDKLLLQAVPGVRVRISFSGRFVDAYVLERLPSSEYHGRLLPVRGVLNDHRVLEGEYRDLLEWVAQRYAGTLSEVIRLAIPPRVARVDKESPFVSRDEEKSSPLSGHATSDQSDQSDQSNQGVDILAWRRYHYGESFINAIEQRRVHASWIIRPKEDLAQRCADIVRLARRAQGATLIIVPDVYDLGHLSSALSELLGNDRLITLSNSDGPTARYRHWLQAFYGVADVIVGTRAAAFAAIPHLHTVIQLDDSDELYAVPNSPYPHVTEVLRERCRRSDANYISVALTRSVEAQYSVQHGELQSLTPLREGIHDELPRISVPGDSDAALERDPLARAARIPHAVYAAVNKALSRGEPVLFQVPRRGYVPKLVCDRCREALVCRHCGGPLSFKGPQDSQSRIPVCRLCGRADKHVSCQYCGSQSVRATVKGTHRTAEELGKAFPGYPIVLSYGSERKTHISSSPAITVATPGAEPVAEEGYGVVALLDTWALLQRPDIMADEEAFRYWAQAISLGKSAHDGGEAYLVGDSHNRIFQALIRWDPSSLSERWLSERSSAHMPPTVNFIALDGQFGSVKAYSQAVEKECPTVESLGPIPLPQGVSAPPRVAGEAVRMLLKVPTEDLESVVMTVRKVKRFFSAKGDIAPVRVQVGPYHVA